MIRSEELHLVLLEDGSGLWDQRGRKLRCGWLLAITDGGTSNGNIMYSYDGISWSDSAGGTSF